MEKSADFIRKKEFHIVFKGYKPEEVDKFLDILSVEFDRLLKRNRELQDSLDKLKFENTEDDTDIKKVIQDALISAHKVAEDIKAQAKKEADSMINSNPTLPDVAVNSAYMGHEKEIQQGMPGINNEIKGTVIAKKDKNIKEAKQMVERAQIILGCLAGQQVQAVARTCRTRPNTVIKWRQRFVQRGLAGLHDAARPGATPVYGVDFRNRVLALLEQPPPAGQACWDGPAVAAALNSSTHAVWRVLRQEGICLQRQRSWCVSTDKEFAAKAADIVGLYLNPPQKALVISVDEKPSIQALERKTGYVETDNGKIVRGFKSTYKRHGTLNLFAALQVATGEIQTATTTLKRREEFLKFMDQMPINIQRDAGL
jgi:DivIVA domain-containing protein